MSYDVKTSAVAALANAATQVKPEILPEFGAPDSIETLRNRLEDLWSRAAILIANAQATDYRYPERFFWETLERLNLFPMSHGISLPTGVPVGHMHGDYTQTGIPLRPLIWNGEDWVSYLEEIQPGGSMLDIILSPFITNQQVVNAANQELVDELRDELRDGVSESRDTFAELSAAIDAVSTALAAAFEDAELTGIPVAPTADPGTDTTQIATTAFVQAALAALVAAAPGALDTLNELAAALGDDENFAATITAALAGKQDTLTEPGDVPGLTAALAAKVSAAGGDGSAILVTPTGASTPVSIAARFGERFYVDAEGAVGNGTADDGAALLAAVAKAKAAGAGVVVLGRGKTYATSSPIVVDGNFIEIVGFGGDVRHDVGSEMVPSSAIKWIGASGATVLKFAPVEGASNQRLVGVGARGFSILCNNVAGRGLQVLSVTYGVFHVTGSKATVKLFDFGVVETLGEATSTQNCDLILFGDQRGSTGIGFSAWGIVPYGNFSYNQRISVTIQHTDADGIVLDSYDNNSAQLMRAARTSGTGNGIIFNGAEDVGTCRGNTFLRVASNAPIIARGTTSFTNPSADNIIYEYDKENGIPDPVIETGATLWWRSNLTNRWNFLDIKSDGALRIGGVEVLKGTSGTWTPAIDSTGGAFATDGYTINSARWTRSGPKVKCDVRFTVGAAGIGAASGTLRITPPSTPLYAGAGCGVNENNGRALAVRWAANATYINVLEYQSNFPVANSQSVVVSFEYFVA